MADFLLIHGGGEGAWHWRPVASELAARGHHGITVDLPSPDPRAELADWADAAARAAGDARDLVVVGHSLGGFVAPLVCDRLSTVDLLVLVAGMIPRPGESVAQWWTATGHAVADPDDDETAQFYADVPADVVSRLPGHAREVAMTAMTRPWPSSAWPDVPTRLLVAEDDRFFPVEFMRGVARDRLGMEPDTMPGGHALNLARPGDLAERLVSYWDDLRGVRLAAAPPPPRRSRHAALSRRSGRSFPAHARSG